EYYCGSWDNSGNHFF
nr:immunoglobulin light chain junction region [Macaca mulatta]MOW15882.1 immunoglobulin light chain junction region [Macaca mulatta]